MQSSAGGFPGIAGGGFLGRMSGVLPGPFPQTLGAPDSRPGFGSPGWWKELFTLLCGRPLAKIHVKGEDLMDGLKRGDQRTHRLGGCGFRRRHPSNVPSLVGTRGCFIAISETRTPRPTVAKPKRQKCRMMAMSLSDVMDMANFYPFYPTTASLTCSISFST